MKYKHVTAGGTFDHFHKGHEALLEKAFVSGDSVWLGITTSAYFSTLNTKTAKGSSLNNLTGYLGLRPFVPHLQTEKITNKMRPKYFGSLQPFEKRQAEVEIWLIQKRWWERAKIIPIADRFGTTLQDEQLEAIVVSPETELVATEINLLRAQKNWPRFNRGWPALDVVVVPWILAEDGHLINSIRIRAGEIDREGKLYRLPQSWGVRHLPDQLRKILKEPLGELIIDDSRDHEEAVKQFLVKYEPTWCTSPLSGKLNEKNGRLLIAVGDAVADALLKIDVTPDISIVDLKIARKQVYKNVAELGFRDIKLLKTAKNKAGTLSFEAYSALLELVYVEARPKVLQINGEEDLLTLLAIFLAPLNSLIVYGQPNKGIVVVEVTEDKKAESRKYLEQFK